MTSQLPSQGSRLHHELLQHVGAHLDNQRSSGSCPYHEEFDIVPYLPGRDSDSNVHHEESTMATTECQLESTQLKPPLANSDGTMPFSTLLEGHPTDNRPSDLEKAVGPIKDSVENTEAHCSEEMDHHSGHTLSSTAHPSLRSSNLPQHTSDQRNQGNSTTPASANLVEQASQHDMGPQSRPTRNEATRSRHKH